MPIASPRWTGDEFDVQRLAAIERFRGARTEEALDPYSDAFEEARQAIAQVLELTIDLGDLSTRALEVTTDASMLEALRYLAGPPISEDDLKVLAEVSSLTASQLRADPASADKLVEFVTLSIDGNRFPWVRDNREPTDGERETAIVSTSAMIAQRRVMTARANVSKEEQEEATKQALRDAGFTEVPSRTIATNAEAPRPGEFCGESMFFGRKADVVVTLRDGRFMPIECKVSNSSTNSVKRLNNDAAAKATHWLHECGTAQTVPSSVLAGVFKRHNLEAAQAAGLTIFWAHALDQLAEFVTAAV